MWSCQQALNIFRNLTKVTTKLRFTNEMLTISVIYKLKSFKISTDAERNLKLFDNYTEQIRKLQATALSI